MVTEARLPHFKGGAADMAKLRELEQKVELLGIDSEDHSRPGFYSNLFCPKVTHFAVPVLLFLLSWLSRIAHLLVKVGDVYAEHVGASVSLYA